MESNESNLQRRKQLTEQWRRKTLNTSSSAEHPRTADKKAFTVAASARHQSATDKQKGQQRLKTEQRDSAEEDAPAESDESATQSEGQGDGAHDVANKGIHAGEVPNTHGSVWSDLRAAVPTILKCLLSVYLISHVLVSMLDTSHTQPAPRELLRPSVVTAFSSAAEAFDNITETDMRTNATLASQQVKKLANLREQTAVDIQRTLMPAVQAVESNVADCAAIENLYKRLEAIDDLSRKIRGSTKTIFEFASVAIGHFADKFEKTTADRARRSSEEMRGWQLLPGLREDDVKEPIHASFDARLEKLSRQKTTLELMRRDMEAEGVRWDAFHRAIRDGMLVRILGWVDGDVCHAAGFTGFRSELDSEVNSVVGVP
jgi:hypothetical protein